MKNRGIKPIDVRESARAIVRKIRTRAQLARVGDVAGEPEVLVTAQPRELSILVVPSGRH